MGTKLNICVATLNRYDLLTKLIESCEKNTIKPDKYIIVDNGLQIDESFFDKDVVHKIVLIVPPKQLALAACWNLFMSPEYKNEEDIHFIVNDDIELSENCIEKLIECYDSTTFDFITIRRPLDGYASGYSAFIYRPSTYREIGKFDETFYPAYFEDCDYHYRFNLLNKKEFHVDVDFIHHGSSTNKKYTKEQQDESVRNFMRNKEYFIEKWGGENGKEVFKTPFNK